MGDGSFRNGDTLVSSEYLVSVSVSGCFHSRYLELECFRAKVSKSATPSPQKPLSDAHPTRSRTNHVGAIAASAVGGVLVLGLFIAAFRWRRRRSSPHPTGRFYDPADAEYGKTIAISPSSYGSHTLSGGMGMPVTVPLAMHTQAGTCAPPAKPATPTQTAAAPAPAPHTFVASPVAGPTGSPTPRRSINPASRGPHPAALQPMNTVSSPVGTVASTPTSTKPPSVSGSEGTAQITHEQADFVAKLHMNNVPAAVIAQLMERMLEGEGRASGSGVDSFNHAPPSYDFHAGHGH